MWPWWWCMWNVNSKKPDLEDDVHVRLQAAAEKLDSSRTELFFSNREARHGTKNLRFVMKAVLDRIEGNKNDKPNA